MSPRVCVPRRAAPPRKSPLPDGRTIDVTHGRSLGPTNISCNRQSQRARGTRLAAPPVIKLDLRDLSAFPPTALGLCLFPAHPSRLQVSSKGSTLASAP